MGATAPDRHPGQSGIDARHDTLEHAIKAALTPLQAQATPVCHATRPRSRNCRGRTAFPPAYCAPARRSGAVVQWCRL